MEKYRTKLCTNHIPYTVISFFAVYIHKIMDRVIKYELKSIREFIFARTLSNCLQ